MGACMTGDYSGEFAAGVYGEVCGVGEVLLGGKEQTANFASTFEFAALI